jgi:hypothetical protein
MRLWVVKDIVSSGGRWLDVAPARFPRWIAAFGVRHGGDARGASLTVTMTSENVVSDQVDQTGDTAGAIVGHTAEATAETITGHALADRAVGVLLVRLGGYAAGVFTGSPPVLADFKTGARPVHGRSAAGGWSQQRFARRRDKQASQAIHAAADAAAGVWGRWGSAPTRSGGADVSGASGGAGGAGTPGTGLDVVVLGGDRRAVAGAGADPRLAPYLRLATGRFLTVPDPRLAVLRDAPRLFLAVRILLTEPAP